MWRRKREEVVKLVLVFLKVGKTGADDEPTERVRNKAYFAEREIWTVLRDIVVDFLRQSDAHLHDVTLSVFFVCARAEEHRLGEEQSDIVLQQTHVVRISLKAMHHHE